MNITQITVSYGETQSLPEYSNVKPNLTITATLDAGEDVALIEAQLWAHAKEAVREQIDQALEGSGKAAKWSAEPRYQVLKTAYDTYLDRGKTPPARLVVILPDSVKLDHDSYGARLVSAVYGKSRKLRYSHAQRVAAEAMESHDGARLLDCSNGDLSVLEAALPPKPTEAALATTVDERGRADHEDIYDERLEDDEDDDE